jgi:hypothetical protein
MNVNYPKIMAEAHDAGIAAGNAKSPTPMIVAQHENIFDDNSPIEKAWHVPSGVCGFAYVLTNEHGNGKFVKYLKSTSKGFGCSAGERYYYGGYYVKWVGEFGQSYEKKRAFAGAFAKVLNSYGIKAYADGRLD